MLQRVIQNIVNWYLAKNRWWAVLIAGCFYSLALPPFNHETHWTLALFPLLNFAVVVPLFACAVQPSFRRAILHCFLFGYTAALGQYHWLVFDRVEGLWHLVILGLFLASGVVACFYLAAGLLFRVTHRWLKRGYVLVFPAIWVLIDYGRSVGDLAFPWAFLGYSFTPVLPVSQSASVWGVWGLTFIAVLGNTLLWEMLKTAHNGRPMKGVIRSAVAFGAILLLICAWGSLRIMAVTKKKNPTATIALLQSNIDQFRWSNRMLDTAFAVSDSLARAAARSGCDLMILPESSLLCYLTHRVQYMAQVQQWVRQTRVPIILGSLDWQNAPSGSSYEYFVYNTAFFVDTGTLKFSPYYKIHLVPFSEAMPFEGVFPILSRVNLGEADFHPGTDQTVFHIGPSFNAGPLICYESIFPAFVRQRVRRGADLLVNITNDGWFGRSSGPRHHAMMARMRSIENGIPLARCANSGISMFVDPLGRVLGHTGLYERTLLVRAIPHYKLHTLYTRFGDWFVLLCAAIVLSAAGWALFTRKRRV